jgi:CRP-like cAMP-binding protein
MESLAVVTSWRRGRQIYGRGDPAEHWYRLISGATRKCALKADGRRQILEIMLPGDFFGFTARDKHMFAVEAVVDGTIVACYPRRRLERMADTDPNLAHFIRDSAFDAMSRMQTRMLILGQITAREKVSAFVLEMADRSPGRTVESVDLPMSRYDIADYLALSVETVSRALTRLRHRGAIAITGKHRVRIIDRNALSEGADIAE